MLATQQNYKNVVKELLKHHFLVNHTDVSNMRAIDLAWLNYVEFNKSEYKRKITRKIMMMLLQAGSVEPADIYGYEFSKAPRKIKKYLVSRDKSSIITEGFDFCV